MVGARVVGPGGVGPCGCPVCVYTLGWALAVALSVCIRWGGPLRLHCLSVYAGLGPCGCTVCLYTQGWALAVALEASRGIVTLGGNSAFSWYKLGKSPGAVQHPLAFNHLSLLQQVTTQQIERFNLRGHPVGLL